MKPPNPSEIILNPLLYFVFVSSLLVYRKYFGIDTLSWGGVDSFVKNTAITKTRAFILWLHKQKLTDKKDVIFLLFLLEADIAGTSMRRF